jgi:hypothetical protein
MPSPTEANPNQKLSMTGLSRRYALPHLEAEELTCKQR